MNNNDKLLHLLQGEEQLQKLMPDYLQQLKQQTQQRQQTRLLVKQAHRQLQNLQRQIKQQLKKAAQQNHQVQQQWQLMQQQAMSLEQQYWARYHQPCKLFQEISALNLETAALKQLAVWSQNLPTDSQLPLKLFQKRLQKLANSTLLTSQQQAYLRTSDYLLAPLINWLSSYTRYRQVAPRKIAQKLEQIQQNLTLAALSNGPTWSHTLQEVRQTLTTLPVILPPKTQPLLAVIHAIRKPQYYVKRGYTVLQVVQPVYAALTRLRQNITNQARYRGMSNAWQNYQLAMQDLRQYYQEHYWQSGGTPHNFHGHDNR